MNDYTIFKVRNIIKITEFKISHNFLYRGHKD